MDIQVRSTSPSSVSDDALVVFAAKGEDIRRTVAAAGRSFASPYDTLIEREAFDGSADQTAVLHAGPSRLPTLVLAGIGPAKDVTSETLRSAASVGVRAARDAGARSVSMAVPTGRGPVFRSDRVAAALAEGAEMGLYRFEAHKRESSQKAVDQLTLLAPRGENRRVERGMERGRAIGSSVCFARDLGNEPGNVATPSYLAEQAIRIAGEEGLDVEIFDEDRMHALGMGALLGVSQGSREPARMIFLTYEPPRRGGRRVDTVAIVGKGLTFDSGGISIKPGPKMEDMKFDMCGGAAVLGTMQAIARVGAPVRVVGVVPTSENLPGGASYKPGDILTAMDGTTIEIRNTDAEGRLILADALCYVSQKLKPKPKAIVDLATLTGACVVALGDHQAGLFSGDDQLADRLLDAGEASGDPVWRMPVGDGHRKQLHSPYADLSNLGTPGAGAGTAAAFLRHFSHGLPWAHLDIAGTAWTDKQSGYLSKGATGFGVRVITRFLQDWAR